MLSYSNFYDHHSLKCLFFKCIVYELNFLLCFKEKKNNYKNCKNVCDLHFVVVFV